MERFLGAPLIAGPTRVPTTREDSDAGQRFTAAHDGYRQRYGLVHERSLFLARDGRTIEGTDRLFAAGGKQGKPKMPAAIRFHLHPGVTAERTADGVILTARKEVWQFHCDADVDLEDSIFFADSAGARRTSQIVITFDPSVRSDVAWRFVKLQAPGA